MISNARTSAPRSSVIHAVDGRIGISLHSTRCGIRIGEAWAGEYNEQPAGDVTCRRCITGCEQDQRDLESAAPFAVGDRVGILTGHQSVSGPWVGSVGTVTGIRAFWNGKPSFLVRADGEAESFVYESWQIVAATTDATCQDCQDTGRWDDGSLCPCVLALVRGEDGIGARLRRRGWLLRRVDRIGPASRLLIMATREIHPVTIDGVTRTREYVVASMRPGDTEWTNGAYRFAPEAADRTYRDRQASSVRVYGH